MNEIERALSDTVNDIIDSFEKSKVNYNSGSSDGDMMFPKSMAGNLILVTEQAMSIIENTAQVYEMKEVEEAVKPILKKIGNIKNKSFFESGVLSNQENVAMKRIYSLCLSLRTVLNLQNIHKVLTNDRENFDIQDVAQSNN